jgi:hypothetical protein
MQPSERLQLIDRLGRLPEALAQEVAGLSEVQLLTHFLAHEWNVAQNVHHLADSHMNAYIRMKLLLTEEHPTIKPYDQDQWSEHPDANQPDLTVSLSILRGLHQRWVMLMQGLSEEQWLRTGRHPESGEISVAGLLCSYAEHGEAHIDQIRRTLAAQAER